MLFALTAMMLASCSQVKEDNLQLVSQQHPAHVVEVVKKYLYEVDQSKFLASLEYTDYNYIIAMDTDYLNSYLPQDELYLFVKELLGTELLLGDKNEAGLEQRNNDCFVQISNSNYALPDGLYPFNFKCVRKTSPQQTDCIQWVWVC